MSIILIALLVIIIIMTLAVIVNLWNSKKIPKDTVLAFTGGLGTGKTYIAVTQAEKEYRKRVLYWRLGFYDEVVKKRPFLLPNKKKKAEFPSLYSNIPIRFKAGLFFPKQHKDEKGKHQWSRTLLYEHILLMERIEQRSVIMIDEVGQMADQYQYDNPFVMQNIQNFIRFYRHFVDGRMFVTDQSSSNIVVAVRRRLNVIYNLHEFRRVWFWFYRVKVSPVMISEDMLTIDAVNQTKTTGDEGYEFFFGWLPLKFVRFLDITRFFMHKKYESRVYFPLYDDVTFNIEQIPQWQAFTTRYLIDVPQNQEMKKEFKKKGYLTNKELKKYIENYSNALYSSTE